MNSERRAATEAAGTPRSGPGVVARLRIVWVAVGLALLTLALAPAQLVLMRLAPRLAVYPPFLWHRAAARLTGIRLRLRGRPAAGRPLLIAANHQSWADIVALGAAMPLAFIAKDDVRGWPVFGWLARLQRTVFVARGRRGEAGRQADAVARRLAAGDAMVLFAEGTTSDGNGVLPFRTSLFGAVQASLRASGEPIAFVQPVAVAWTRVHGLPMGRFWRPLAGWPGAVPLGSHFAAFLREGAVDVEVAFGEPIAFTAADDRKAVARRSEEAARALLSRSLRDPL